jgi:hypothetical protein
MFMKLIPFLITPFDKGLVAVLVHVHRHVYVLVLLNDRITHLDMVVGHHGPPKSSKPLPSRSSDLRAGRLVSASGISERFAAWKCTYVKLVSP